MEDMEDLYKFDSDTLNSLVHTSNSMHTIHSLTMPLQDQDDIVDYLKLPLFTYFTDDQFDTYMNSLPLPTSKSTN